jgi:hypothetical protein
VLEVFSKVKSRECLIIISDMPVGSWKSLIPDSVLNPVIVDIAAHEKTTKRKMLKGKAVPR